MKKILLSLIITITVCLIASEQLFAQATNEEMLSKTWQFFMPTTVTESNEQGVALPTPATDIAKIGFQFRVINIVSIEGRNEVVIQFLKWDVDTKQTATGKELRAPTSDKVDYNDRFYLRNFTANFKSTHKESLKRYFFISRQEFDSRCKEYLPKHQFSVGVLTLPIKIRFGNKSSDETKKAYSSFSGNISAGLSVGWKKNYNRLRKPWSTTLLTGFSLTSVPVSKETTNDYVQSETNEAALTWHLGFLASIDNFQIGVFTGIDYLSGQVNKNWVYRNKPWLGIGIGFSFFNAKKTSDTQ